MIEYNVLVRILIVDIVALIITAAIILSIWYMWLNAKRKS